MSTSDSKNLTVVGPRSQLQWVSVIGSSPVDWYAISAEQADALPHVWQKGASAMCGLLGLAGLGQLGPDQTPVVGPKVAAGHSASSGKLNGRRKNWGCSTETGGHIAEMTDSCPAGCGQICFLDWIQRSEMVFEVHASITSNDVLLVNIV